METNEVICEKCGYICNWDLAIEMTSYESPRPKCPKCRCEIYRDIMYPKKVSQKGL